MDLRVGVRLAWPRGCADTGDTRLRSRWARSLHRLCLPFSKLPRTNSPCMPLWRKLTGVFIGVAAGNAMRDLDVRPVTPACYGKEIPGVMTVMGELMGRVSLVRW